MAKKYRQVGKVYAPEPDNDWIGILVVIGIVLFLMAACGG